MFEIHDHWAMLGAPVCDDLMEEASAGLEARLSDAEAMITHPERFDDAARFAMLDELWYIQRTEVWPYDLTMRLSNVINNMEDM